MSKIKVNYTDGSLAYLHKYKNKTITTEVEYHKVCNTRILKEKISGDLFFDYRIYKSN
jgi:hypothetical protein